MAEFLLTSEAFVKSVSSISDNVAGKYIQSSIREAQEIGLKSILGSCLLTALKEKGLAKQFDLPENVAYKDLVDKCQYFLAYSAIVEVIYKTSFKLANMGVLKSQDQGMQPPTKAEIDNQRAYYQSKADACALDLQAYLWENRTLFPELNENDCHRIQSNLYSAATCGIFLGGARGKWIQR